LADNLTSSLNKKIVKSKPELEFNSLPFTDLVRTSKRFAARQPISTRTTKSGKVVPVYAPIGEQFTLPSLTVPDMSIPLPTLLKRYRRDGTEFLEGVYTGDDPDLPDNFEKMDKMQRIDFARENAARIAEGRAKLDKSRTASTEAALKAQFDAAVAKAAAELPKPPSDPS